ncbi:hypothetical protein BACCAP_02696 [Pseudoflavonifractor capillosus ATCC 29799]|uniref:Uncharacterized protein n=1 Tax=Pseudoflavonifractor capillosus ATCC 29799 TaxID=411467 RepID=A6NWV1_9FIRM|nr:hypothetical protein [Pseudoflavonifractor capillosus]EDM99443.1 hypothetical protein BACCAP_02696 [Pseudoflavonifractor capillosus ATCC 29799]
MGALESFLVRPFIYTRGANIMKHNTDTIALKLVHMMFCNGLIDSAVYHQVLNRYA